MTIFFKRDDEDKMHINYKITNKERFSILFKYVKSFLKNLIRF